MARNRGLEAVESEYVTFFDSDDGTFPEMINAIRQAITKQQADIIAYTYTFMKTNERCIRCFSNQPKIAIIRNAGHSKFYCQARGNTCDWRLGRIASEMARLGSRGVRLLFHTDNIYWIKYPPLCRAHIRGYHFRTKFFGCAHFSL